MMALVCFVLNIRGYYNENAEKSDDDETQSPQKLLRPFFDT